MRSGIPLEEALLAVSQQSEKARVRSVVAGVRARVMEGRTLAEGLGAFPTVFPEIYRATVSAGEQSGHLDAVLERMADYTENRQILQQKIRNAMIYPVLLTVICLGIVGLLLGYVVPEVVRVFEAGDRELPILTRLLIAASDFLRAWWWLLIALAGGILWGFRRWLREPAARRSFDLLKLAHAARRTHHARQQCRALRAHILDPDGERRAGARGAQDRGRGRHQLADAPGRRRMRPCGSARARRSPARWGPASCSRRCSCT